MLENARRGSCQQIRGKLEIEEERYAERSEEDSAEAERLRLVAN